MGHPEHVAVVGAGLAGIRTIEQLRAAGFTGAISLIGAEPHPPYDRPPLSKQVLTGAQSPDRIVLKDTDALTALDVRTHLGVPAVALHDGSVELADGQRVTADAVVIATGAHPRTLPDQPDTVHTLRTLDDSLALRTALADATSLLVVGGGFIGAEVAWAALNQGLHVTIVEALAVPCERALGPDVGQLCGRLITDNGVDLRLGAKLEGFRDAHTVELADGDSVTADVVLVGIGAVPALDWLRGTDLDTTNGIACDATGRALGTTGIWALGDVAAWHDSARGRHFRNEHWTSAIDQATVVARDILGAEPPPPTVPYFWSDQFGLKIQGIGRPDLCDDVVALRGEGMAGGPVKGTVAGYFRADHLVAVVGFGAAKWVARYRALVAGGASRAEAEALV